MKFGFIAIILLLGAFITVSAQAACSLPSTAMCDGAPCSEAWPVGSIVYNADYGVPQLCRNGIWVALAPAPSNVQLGCRDIGDECSDGTFYAGQLGSGPVFVYGPEYQVSRTWNNGTTSWIATGFNSPTDGQSNTAGLVARSGYDSPYLAAEYCAGLSAHGYNDWYLPSRAELNLVWNNGTPIAGVSSNHTDWYWSSTETSFQHHTDQHAMNQNFGNGDISVSQKSSNNRVRCVRRF